MRIGVIGLGYVGSSVAALFSKKYIVNLYDKDPIKSELLANGRSPIKDKLAEKEILKRKGNFIVSKDIDECSKNSDVIFICVSTDLNKTGNGLETRNLEDCVLKARKCNRKNLIIIKSTIPYNFLPNFLIDNNLTNVFYVPEFLRESEAYKDITKPSRIVIGCIKKEKRSMMPSDFLKILSRAAMLKTTTRHCVTEKNRKESVADHSWRIALMAMLLSKEPEFQDTDMNKVIRMCLIHDLGETFTGDLPAFEKTDADTVNEDALFFDWVRSFPAAQRLEWLELLNEMKELQTKEAKTYKALDKLEAVISHNESDLSTWLPLEYDLQLTYGKENIQFSEYLKALSERIDEWTKNKIKGLTNFR